jgi:hypothetical protein
MGVNLDEVVSLAEQLDSEQQDQLIVRLHAKRALRKHATSTTTLPTRETLLAKVEQLRQTPPNPADSLLGKYTNAAVAAMSEAEFHAHLNTIATEWKQELNDLTDHQD